MAHSYYSQSAGGNFGRADQEQAVTIEDELPPDYEMAEYDTQSGQQDWGDHRTPLTGAGFGLGRSAQGVDSSDFLDSYKVRRGSGRYDNNAFDWQSGETVTHPPDYASYISPVSENGDLRDRRYSGREDQTDGQVRYRRNKETGWLEQHASKGSHLVTDEDRASLQSIDLSRPVSISRNLLATLRIARASRRERNPLPLTGNHLSRGSVVGSQEEVGMPSLEQRKVSNLRQRLLESREHHDVKEMAEALRDQGAIGSLKRQGEKTWAEYKSNVKGWLYQFELWAGSFKEIEGRFGSATVSYFTFVRWLLFLNLIVFLITFLVIVVPFVAFDHPKEFKDITGDSLNGNNNSTNCSREYEEYIASNITGVEVLSDQVLDFIQGTGWMERTVLFYGLYYNKTERETDENNKTERGSNKNTEEIYNIGLAYLLAIGICFVISFLLILRNSAKTVQESVLDQDSSIVNFSNRVFCGWDFCIANEKSAKTTSNNLLYELKRDLEEQKRALRRAEETAKDKAKLFVKRLFINLFVLVILAGSLAVIYTTADRLREVQNHEDNFVKLLVQYSPSLTITFLNFVVPIGFAKIVLYEDYSPSNELRMTLVRTVLLRLSSLGILIVNLYIQFFGSHETSVCGNTKRSANIYCWETYIGQQFYKLTLLDFVAVVILTFFFEFPRKFIYDRYQARFSVIKFIGQEEFDLPVSVLDIVYTQTLCWFGMIFSPLLPAVTLVKVFLIFYMKKLSLMKNCVPPVRAYQASRSKSFFMIVLLLSFMLCALPVGYMVGNLSPSQSCGPFRVYSSANHTMFQTLTWTIQTWSAVPRDIFLFLGTAGFFIPAIIVLCLLMYYFWASTQGYKKKEEMLKEQLRLEGKDKQYLLARVNEVYKRDLG